MTESKYVDQFRFDDLSLDGSRALIVALKNLKENQGWVYIQKLLHQQYLSAMATMVANPLDDGAAVYRQEYMKGQASVYCIVGDMPDTLLEHLQANVQMIQESQEEAEDGYGN